MKGTLLRCEIVAGFSCLWAREYSNAHHALLCGGNIRRGTP